MGSGYYCPYSRSYVCRIGSYPGLALNAPGQYSSTVQKDVNVVDSRTTPNYPIASVDKALRLLLMFRTQRSVRLSDASKNLGVAHSTAHRLLAMLAYHDFVSREEGSRTYVAGPALVEVGLAVVRNMDIRTCARPILEELVTELDETVHLAILEGRQVRYLDSMESTKALRVASRTGKVLPAHCTAVGKALLAELAPEKFREIYPSNQELPAQTERSITSVPVLEQELDRVREKGYATNSEEIEDGVGSVATVVHDTKGRAVATISVAAPVSRLDDRRRAEIASALHSATKKLGESLPVH